MSLIAAPFAILAILYAGGFLAQLLGNYARRLIEGATADQEAIDAELVEASENWAAVFPAMVLHRWPLRPTSFSAFPLCSDRLMACMAF